MEVLFRDESYRSLESDPKFTGGYSAAIVKAYRNRMNFIRQAPDDRDLYAWKSLRFEKLRGNRGHQHSLRLNDQWRLIIELEGAPQNKKIVIVGIEDYHGWPCQRTLKRLRRESTSARNWKRAAGASLI